MSSGSVLREKLLTLTHLPIAVYVAYLGFLYILFPDPTLTDSIPDWLTAVWGASLIGGAVLILWGALADRSRMESIGHAFHLFGVSMFIGLLASQGALTRPALVAFLVVSLMRMRTLGRARRAKVEVERLLAAEEV